LRLIWGELGLASLPREVLAVTRRETFDTDTLVRSDDEG
jgi:hypothetical protein